MTRPCRKPLRSTTAKGIIVTNDGEIFAGGMRKAYFKVVALAQPLCRTEIGNPVIQPGGCLDDGPGLRRASVVLDDNFDVSARILTEALEANFERVRPVSVGMMIDSMGRLSAK